MPTLVPHQSLRIATSQGGFTLAPGNINTDPLFLRVPNPGPDGQWGTTDDDYGNLNISPASPVADAGSNAVVPTSLTTDSAGNPRFQEIVTAPQTGIGTPPIVDMGAYEATPGLAANAGGPYVVLQGKSLTLSGHGASDIAGALQYAWDWTGNGLFDDASAPDPAFPVSSFPVGATVNVSLRITDSTGRTIISTTSVRIAPLVAYVDAAATAGANTGADWPDAFTSLAGALNSAASGETFHVAQGTYTPTPTALRTFSFNLQSDIAIYGGYAGSADPTAPDTRNVTLYPSILSGDIGTIGNNADNSYHVLTALNVNSTAIIDGFTITAGNANGADLLQQDDGAGLLDDSSTSTINNCTFIANFATNDGDAARTTTPRPPQFPTLHSPLIPPVMAVPSRLFPHLPGLSPAVRSIQIRQMPAVQSITIYLHTLL